MKTRPVVVMAIMAGSCAAFAATGGVRDAALRVYIHGMTAEIADRDVGRGGVRELLELLDDPAFPRRDNVVSFLAYLGGAESTQALVRMLGRPMPHGATIEDDRALLLVPHALGRMAGRGERSALDALLALTAEDAALHEPSLPGDVRGEAITALALTGKSEARDRLTAIAGGTIVPDRKHPELAACARAALESDAATRDGSVAASAYDVAFVSDPATQTHAHGLTYVNHVDLSSPMTPSRLDQVLAEGTHRVATGDFAEDVACCAVVRQVGSGGTFGTSGDGLDVIDDEADLAAAIDQSAARVKVVSVINYCGSSGTNIIGCAFTPGHGMVLVRLSGIGHEAVLWVHEYGHNLGLSHSSDVRAMMYGSDNGMNNGLAGPECMRFHTPSPSASAVISVEGICTGDVVADVDSSGRVDGHDLAILGRAFGASVGQPGYDARADLDHDLQVDGADLALLARDFGK